MEMARGNGSLTAVVKQYELSMFNLRYGCVFATAFKGFQLCEDLAIVFG